MAFKKETLLKLSTFAYVIAAVSLCNLTQDIIMKLIILISVSVIGGIQGICIRKIYGEKKEDPGVTEDGPMS